MNYQRIYTELISNARLKGAGSYFEIHHVIPRCLGGTDDASNLVDLTARAHFLAHLLLAKIYGGRLWLAATMMRRGAKTSRLYEIAKAGHAQSLRGVPLSQSRRDKISKAVILSQTKPEVREKISNALRVALNKPETVAKLSAAKLGKPLSQAHKDSMRVSQNRPETKLLKSAALKAAWARRKSQQGT